jgi:hypothetical protein
VDFGQIVDIKWFRNLVPPPYSVALLISTERTITKERLTRYLGATAQNTSKALGLYEYNVQLSELA